jgi:hypothetical protein
MKMAGIALLVVTGWVAAGNTAVAQQPSCKLCGEQQKACMKNYAGPTCKSEYQICMKSCKKS